MFQDMWKIGVLGLCLVGLTGPAMACMGTNELMPPANRRAEPTVPYKIIELEPFGMQALCGVQFEGEEVRACSLMPPSYNSPDKWVIVVLSGISAADRDCLLTYEKSHLPPNFWGDPNMEPPEIMAKYHLTP